MGNRATHDLGNKSVRARLKPRRKPYYTSIQPRLTLGWMRVSKSEAGRWIARLEVGRNEEGHPLHRQRTLGLADDLGVADGKAILSFQQAVRLAADPYAVVTQESPLTFQQAVDRYTESLRARSKHADADRSRLVNRMPEELLGMPVIKLSKTSLEAWRDSLLQDESESDRDGRRRSQDTANRLLTIAKAALSHALADESNGIDNDRAWKLVKPFAGASRPREFHFSEAEVRKWVAAAKRLDPALANLIEGGFHTGARLGELVACDVGHFDLKRAQLHVPHGKTGARTVLLPVEACEFFKRISTGRAKTDPLLPNASGERWTKSTHHRPIKKTLQAAGLDTGASFYSLRHTAASRRIERGQPLMLIAEELGTSTQMLEKTYGKFLRETRRKLIEETAPTLRLIKGGRRAA